MITNTGWLIPDDRVIQWGVTDENGDIKLWLPVSFPIVYSKLGPINSFTWLSAHECHIGQPNLQYLVIGINIHKTTEQRNKYDAYDDAMGVV